MGAKGISQIKIPIKADELTITAVEPYLDEVFNKFQENSAAIREDYDFFCLNQSILGKERTHNDTDVNNIVCIPNIRSAVEWRAGYLVGNPINYAQTENDETDDIKVLNRYCRAADKATVDSDVITWAEATGVGYYFIEPKSDTNIDLRQDAPFELYMVEADKCAKVYSSFNGNKPLFDLIYTTYQEIDSNKRKTTVKVLDIYFPDTLYTFTKGGSGKWKLKGEPQSRGMAKPLPLVEKRPNKDGIGAVAMGRDMADTMDMLISSSIDNVQEIVDEFFIYYNVDLGKDEQSRAEAHRKARKSGAIQLKGTNPDLPPKVDTIAPKLSLNEVRELYGVVNAVFHATLGVPMEASSTNSGGTTKSGSEVANGYDNAYNRALKTKNSYIRADRELLYKIMWICRNTAGNAIDNISASDIEVKYNYNLTDNILTKSQAFGTLIQFMPPAMVLRFTRMSNDPEVEGKQIENSPAYQAYIAGKTKSFEKGADGGTQETPTEPLT